jgi:hypothetical protein
MFYLVEYTDLSDKCHKHPELLRGYIHKLAWGKRTSSGSLTALPDWAPLQMKLDKAIYPPLAALVITIQFIRLTGRT